MNNFDPKLKWNWSLHENLIKCQGFCIVTLHFDFVTDKVVAMVKKTYYFSHERGLREDCLLFPPSILPTRLLVMNIRIQRP